MDTKQDISANGIWCSLWTIHRYLQQPWCAVAWNEWCPKNYGWFDYWTLWHLRLPFKTHVLGLMPWTSFYYVNQWGPSMKPTKRLEYLNGHIDKTQPFALVVSMNLHTPVTSWCPTDTRRCNKNLRCRDIILPTVPTFPPKALKWATISRNNIHQLLRLRDRGRWKYRSDNQRIGNVWVYLKTLSVVFTSDHGICMGLMNKPEKDNIWTGIHRDSVLILMAEK